MADDEPINRSEVTFSQAEGIEPLPQQLNLRELSPLARSVIWKLVNDEIRSDSTRPQLSSPSKVVHYWGAILRDYHVYHECKPVDEYNNHLQHVLSHIKKIIFQQDYNVVFDFLQFVLRHPNKPQEFGIGVATSLRTGRCASRLSDDQKTILPAASEEEGDAISGALKELGTEGLSGAKQHLLQAGEFLTAGENSQSIHESIQAIESVARLLAPDQPRTFRSALKALEDKHQMHPALKDGFNRIYGYSSDERGIRHPMLDELSKVGEEEAVFMLGACASLITYMIKKARKAGIDVD